MKDFENYSKDLLKLNPTLRFVYGMKDKETLSHIENNLNDDYLNSLKSIADKYRNSKDKELTNQIKSIDLYLDNKLYLLLFDVTNNFIIDFNYSTDNIYPPNEEYKLARAKDFDKILVEVIKKTKESILYKMTFPKIIIKKFLKQLKELPKYKPLYDFIKKYYYPYCRNEIGMCYLPNGKQLYREIIKESIGYLDLTPEEIHKIGLDLNKDKIIKGEFYKSREELLNDAIKYANHIYEVIIDKYFHFKMKTPFKIEPVAKELEKSSSLGYYHSLEKAVFINLSYYNEVSKAELYSLLMHECSHYYHFEFMEYHNIPKYKIYIYSNDALIEGFAHYMETYCEDYSENNVNTLLRKLRLVVDTGINYYGWTYKQAYDYLIKYLPNKKTDIINEIERYICNPGQALSYYIGKMHIMKLRDEFLEKKGNIKDFHQKLLINGLSSFN